MPISSAIVIFEKPKSKDVCINAHARYAPKNGYGKKPSLDFLFRGHYHLEVTSAPEPNAIYWENYNENSCRKLIFIVIFVILILILLLVTFSFTLAMGNAFDALKYDKYCPKQYLYAKIENVST